MEGNNIFTENGCEIRSYLLIYVLDDESLIAGFHFP